MVLLLFEEIKFNEEVITSDGPSHIQRDEINVSENTFNTLGLFEKEYFFYERKDCRQKECLEHILIKISFLQRTQSILIS